MRFRTNAQLLLLGICIFVIGCQIVSTLQTKKDNGDRIKASLTSAEVSDETAEEGGLSRKSRTYARGAHSPIRPFHEATEDKVEAEEGEEESVTMKRKSIVSDEGDAEEQQYVKPKREKPAETPVIERHNNDKEEIMRKKRGSKSFLVESQEEDEEEDPAKGARARKIEQPNDEEKEVEANLVEEEGPEPTPSRQKNSKRPKQVEEDVVEQRTKTKTKATEENIEEKPKSSKKTKQNNEEASPKKQVDIEVQTEVGGSSLVNVATDFSILIPVTDKVNSVFLRHCLESLLINIPVPSSSSKSEAPSWEVVVVLVKENPQSIDYVSSERVRAAIDDVLRAFSTKLGPSFSSLRVPSFRFLPGYAQNISAAFNYAARESKGEYLLFLSETAEVPKQTWPSFLPDVGDSAEFNLLSYLISIFQDKAIDDGKLIPQPQPSIEALAKQREADPSSSSSVSASASASPSFSRSASPEPTLNEAAENKEATRDKEKDSKAEESKNEADVNSHEDDEPVSSISSRVGVVGLKVVYGGSGAEGTGKAVYHAGVDFMYAKNPNNDNSGQNRFTEAGKKQPNVIVPYHRYQGYNDKNKKVNNLELTVDDMTSPKKRESKGKFNEEEVMAVGKIGMVVPKNLFLGMKGFSEKYSHQYMDIDFCLRLQHYDLSYLDSSSEKGIDVAMKGTLEVLYVPFPVINYYESSASTFGVKYSPAFEVESGDAKAYATKWGQSPVLKNYIHSRYEMANTSVLWNMECGTGQVLGFTVEAINIALGLHNKLSLHIETRDLGECVKQLGDMGMPVSVLTILGHLQGKSFASPEEGPNVLYMVVHRDPGRYRNFITDRREAIPDYYIGRSMYETDRIPSDWVDNCNNLVNEIWVPSDFNIETFSKSNVERKKLFQVPEAVDIYAYDPEIVSPLIGLDIDSKYIFLTAMKWEKRKGWDLLLRAYFTEFSAKDDVTLLFLSKLSTEDQDKYKEEVKKICYDLDKDIDNLPEVRFLWDRAPFSKLPSLYKTVDCFVLPTHGEGWGLPLMEAMTMELPTIATNWSGNTQFMTAENSFLVPVDSMVEANKDKHLWAKPSVEQLGKIMRFVHDHPDEAKEKGKQARKDAMPRYSQEAVGATIVNLLKDIQENRLEEGKKANEGKNFNAQSSFDWNSWGLGKDAAPAYKLSDLPKGWTRIKIVEDA